MRQGRLDIVRLMLAAGAAATLGDDPSPLEIAIMRLDTAHLDLDTRRCRRNNPDDERAALSALEDKRNGRIDLIRVLVEHGAIIADNANRAAWVTSDDA